MLTSSHRPMIAPPTTLPGAAYTSPDVFNHEIERIFCEQWVCCGREERIAQSGQYFLQEVGRENIIVLRDRQGQVRAFYNVCRHRGTRMCAEPQGHLSQSIQCPYHAWTYSLDGRLIGAPHMEETSDFDKTDYALHSVATAVWEGFIFVNLSRHPEPFEQAYQPVIGKFGAWHLPELRVARRIDYDVKANWKLIVENYSECYHCPGVHPALSRLSPYRSGDNDLAEGGILGGTMDLMHSVGSMTLSGRACSLPLGDVVGRDLNRVHYYSLFPNALLSLHPDYVMLHTLWPQAADRTLISCEWLFSPAAMSQPGFDPQDAVGFWDMTNRQDWHVCGLSQLGVSSRAYTPGPYSTLEALPTAFDRHYLSVMHERADGLARASGSP